MFSKGGAKGGREGAVKAKQLESERCAGKGEVEMNSR